MLTRSKNADMLSVKGRRVRGAAREHLEFGPIYIPRLIPFPTFFEVFFWKRAEVASICTGLTG